MQQEFAKLNQTQIITGFNTLAMVVMLVFIVRSNLEMKNSIEEIRKEIAEIKTNTNDNTKRSTLSLSRLSQRLEDQAQRIDVFSKMASMAQDGRNLNSTSMPAAVFKEPVIERNTYRNTGRDDVDLAISALMN